MLKNSVKKKFYGFLVQLAENISYFMVPFSICYFATLLSLGFLTHFVEVKNEPLFIAVQKVDLSGFFLLVGAVIGSIGIRSADKRPVAGALFCAFVLVFTSMVLRMVPPDVRFEALADPVKSLLGWFFLLFPASMVGVTYFCMAAVFHARLDATPSPISKNDDARPTHAPTDLAQDLRLSRSRARRSRVGR